ncbi:F-box/LRR-repeat protein 4-like [Lotus japonicus]|uniref:F-box/LRR-repeat protein 4-like n=1 Tax=Lotus japonicus TaxID=34305 RepID=UPI00258BE30F|nr:F-box/LRR-repeat protein 4-like [Lotus japonicus]
MSAAIYLPDECWECVFRLLNNNQDHHCMESLSLVSKQFLSITNRLRSSFAIHDDYPDTFLPRLLHRFPNLTSLDLKRFRGDLDALLLLISRSPLRSLTSLSLFHDHTFPADGLRALAENTKTFTSLTCSEGSIATADLHLITDCFPFLQELDLTFSKKFLGNRLRVERLPLALPKLLRKVNLSGESLNINDEELISVCKNCEFLEELVIFSCPSITQHGIASAIRQRPGLRSFSVDGLGRGSKRGDFERRFVTASFIDSLVSLKSLTCLEIRDSCISDELLCSVAKEGLPLRKLVLDDCRNYNYAGISCLLSRCKFVQHLSLQRAKFLNDQLVAELSVFLGSLISIDISSCMMLTESALLALIRNCSLLSEIKMKVTGIGEEKFQYSNSFMNHCVKSLHLGWNLFLGDETIKMLSLVCPNLQVFDLRYCSSISEGGVVEVLKRSCKIRHLNLSHCSPMKLHGMNFEVPNVEVLSLAYSGIDDETLSVVSKSFSGLKYLDLELCGNVTDKGVRQVVENCKQLREINF